MHKLGKVGKDIQEAMAAKVQEFESDIMVQIETNGIGDAEVVLEHQAGLEQDEEEDGEEAGGDGTGSATNQGPGLRLGCFCARGYHRGVAFVEELARRAWAEEWGVEVVHRD
jgi:hypothetical protein